MKLIEQSIKAPVSVAVAVILVALFGVIALLRIPIQLTPDIDQPRISVQNVWPGASPQEVEREITDRQEEQLKGIEGLLEMTSESLDGSSSDRARVPGRHGHRRRGAEGRQRAGPGAGSRRRWPRSR